MDINKLLKNIPIGRSQYEFDNFVLGSSNAAARQVRTLLVEKEEYERQLAQLANSTEDSRYVDAMKKVVHNFNCLVNELRTGKNTHEYCHIGTYHKPTKYLK